jgi:outer membrane cobalamin receptor
MTVRKLVLLFFMSNSQSILAQDTIAKNLPTVLVSDIYLKKYTASQNILTLTSETLNNNKPSLTSLLNYNTTIYCKENGLGMVSSVSFRGTTAQQTAVIWNGIAINSQLNGQTDFNTISTRNYDNIAIRAGGGSPIYGSSAIGGSIHLNNDLIFKKAIATEIQQDFGSFNTFNSHINTKFSTDKLALHIGFSRNASTNDYDYVGVYDYKGNQQKNLNGQYNSDNLNANFGYKINPKNCLKLYTQTSNLYRNFSLISASDTKTKYVDNSSRNLLEFEGLYHWFTINFKNAFVYENYQYYGNIESDYYSSGKVESFISKIDFGFNLTRGFKINTILDYNHAKGFGTSINNITREISSGSILMSYKIDDWQNQLVIKKEVTSAYNSPVLFSLGTTYQFNSWYQLKLNGSKNFRIPTYNDLYYSGGGGKGNPDLKPESAYQGEVGNVFTYKKITFSQTAYYIKMQDLISWQPSTNGNWSPVNVKNVTSYGLESILHYKNNFNRHYFTIGGSYGYTVSRDLVTNNQLPYVPFHKVTTSIGYNYCNFSVNYQFLYNGFVYTLADNKSNQIVKSYKVSNIGLDYDFKFLQSFKLGIQLANIFNYKYQSVEGRYMPGQNFNIYINFKF